jgi:hypothetical protein
VIAEVKPGGRISDITHSDTSPGRAVRDQGDSEPGKWVERSKVKDSKGKKIIRPCLGRRECNANLMYRIDERLSVISTEVTNHLDLIFARED